MTKQYLLDDLILGILRENLIFRETHSKDKTIYELFKYKRITSLQINYNSPKFKEKYQALFTVCFSNGFLCLHSSPFRRCVPRNLPPNQDILYKYFVNIIDISSIMWYNCSIFFRRSH